jgi:nucleolar protein 56
VGARLISHAGSLTNLCKYPASTVQILGAEKALFRALKTKGNTPKYSSTRWTAQSPQLQAIARLRNLGATVLPSQHFPHSSRSRYGLIFHSSFIGRAAAKNKGRISRYLANKCSIASRIDNFADVPTSKYGDKLKEQVEQRLRFYDSGEAPKKNMDAMQEVLDEIKAESGGGDKLKKKDKKDKVRKGDADAEEEAPPKKKKKKDAADEPAAAEDKEKKKKKKDKEGSDKKKKKKDKD